MTVKMLKQWRRFLSPGIYDVPPGVAKKLIDDGFAIETDEAPASPCEVLEREEKAKQEQEAKAKQELAEKRKARAEKRKALTEKRRGRMHQPDQQQTPGPSKTHVTGPKETVEKRTTKAKPKAKAKTTTKKTAKK